MKFSDNFREMKEVPDHLWHHQGSPDYNDDDDILNLQSEKS